MNERIAWSAREYDPATKSADWYWVLGILAVAGAIASFLLDNVLFAIVILLAGGVLALSSRATPPVHEFTLSDEGLAIDGRLLPFGSMVSFSAIEYLTEDGSTVPVLSLRTKRVLMPLLTVPLSGAPVDDVLLFLDERVPLHAHEESVIERVIELLRI